MIFIKPQKIFNLKVFKIFKPFQISLKIVQTFKEASLINPFYRFYIP